MYTKLIQILFTYHVVAQNGAHSYFENKGIWYLGLKADFL